MSSPRLRAQFEKLFEHFDGKDSGIQLDEITEILFCTRRNARIVLNKLEEEGWIEWHPAAGRGNLSRLVFKRNRQDVSENLAKRYLEEGKIGQALNVLDRDSGKLAKVIEGYLGVQHVEGAQVIRLPYYRALSMLNPIKHHRRSEQHIIHQVFSGLTRLDEKEQIQPDLAHTWEALSSTHWRFYLRKGIRFHNGNNLQTSHVVESLALLSKQKTLFSHIERVSSPAPLIVDIELNKPDWYLPLFLCEASAKIMPPEEWRSDSFDLLPIGTGPYRVALNNDKKLVLEVFDGYYGFRPLVDKVEVWVIDDAYSAMVFPSLSNPIAPHNSSADDVELDPGCTYLLLNRKNGLFKDEQWAKYIVSRLNSFNLFKSLPEQTIIDMGLLPATGLKPGWQHMYHGGTVAEKPGTSRITLAYHAQHPVFPAMVKSISKLLESDGHHVELVRYDYHLDRPENVDIWFKPMGIGTNRDDALAAWLLDYSDISKLSNRETFAHWHNIIDEWRSQSDAPFPSKQIGLSLSEHCQIIPMFHCWLGVSKDHCGTLQNARCNALGWFDFSSVWIKPDLSV
ncbi:SgrR family transcriptional regulator [Vibrio hannami]|uniref:SgrR family transcriptional regulator n=1 Tax=Vibrio hannami TaxID=2717094 RepID=UPI00240EAF7F|nr:SgrR family transcriptional regulator [Vibrio hannami]MDG3085433.1 SgrR family transcriptional regulator [Vibrio hannami]